MLRKPLLVALCVGAMIFGSAQRSDALVITRNFTGGAAHASTVGGGNLVDIFNAAADWWEMSILDTHTVTIDYSWAGLGGSTLGVHNLLAQAGVPNRETAARIRFDNDGTSVFFADPTPHDNSEFTVFTETAADYGGGSVNNGRVYTGATGLAVGRIDLLSVAKHEIGHALGLSSANTSFIAENGDLDIDVTGPRPFAGSVLPTISGAHLNIASSLMFPSFSNSMRKVQSAVDILANAQISQFTNLNLDPKVPGTPGQVPEPASMLLWALGFGFVAMRRRRKK